MPFGDDLDLMMRAGLEELAPTAPSDLPEMVEARLATRKRHRTIRRVSVAIAAVAVVAAIASLMHQATRQHPQVEHPSTQTIAPARKGAAGIAPARDAAQPSPGALAGSNASGPAAGSGLAAGGGIAAPGNGSSTPATHGGSHPGTPPADDVPHLDVTRNTDGLVVSASSVPTGLVDITYTDERGPSSASVLQVSNGAVVQVPSGRTVQVRTGDVASLSIVSVEGGQIEPGNALVRVLPPPVAPPTELGGASELTVDLHAGSVSLPYREIVTYLKLPYTEVQSGEITVHVRNIDHLDREIRFDGINSKWRLRNFQDEISFRVTLNGGTDSRFLFHADPASGAPEQLLLGLG